MNIVKDEKHISIDEALELINRRTYSLLFNSNFKAQGVSVFFDMDAATVEEKYLILSRYNSYDKFFVPLTEIADVVYTADECVNESICFSLTNGEVWNVFLCGDDTNYQSEIKNYEEIEIEEFLGKLRRCSEVYVIHTQDHLSFNTCYDIVTIDYDDDCICIMLSTSDNHFNNCKIHLDEYGDNAKCHFLSKDDDLEKFCISLPNMPLFSRLVVGLFYSED